MTASNGWSYSAGEPGLNRVRVFEHPKSGVLYMEYRERDQRCGENQKRSRCVGDEPLARVERREVEGQRVCDAAGSDEPA